MQVSLFSDCVEVTVAVKWAGRGDGAAAKLGAARERMSRMARKREKMDFFMGPPK